MSEIYNNLRKSIYKRIQIIAEGNKEFVTLEDGSVYYWSRQQGGALSASELRILADILDEKNKELHENSIP